MKKKSLAVNATLNGFKSLLNLIFPLITFPYVSRVLSVSDIGKFNFIKSIINYFMLIAALGINGMAIREGSKYRENRADISAFASQVFSMNLISTAISYSLLFLFMMFSRKTVGYRAGLFIYSLQIIFTTIGTEWLYTIFEEYRYITIRSIVFKIISVILLFTFVRHEGDYLKYTAVNVFAMVGSYTLNFINARKYCDIRFTLKIDWGKYLRPVLTLFATTLAIQIFVNSDLTILGYLKDDSIVGIYSFSARIYAIIKSVLAAVVMATVPRAAFYVGKGMTKEYNNMLKKTTSALYMLMLPCIVGLIMQRRNIILIIGGEKYLPSMPSLTILAFSIFFAVHSTLFSQIMLLPHKREKIFFWSAAVSAVTNVLLNFILIPYFSEIGAACTTLLSEFIIALGAGLGSRDIIAGKFRDKQTVFNLLSIAAGCAGIVFVCSSMERLIDGPALQCTASIAASVVTYGLIVLLLRNSTAVEAFGNIMKKVKRKK